MRLGITGSDRLPVVAFSNPDGTIGVFGHNDTGAAQVIGVAIHGRERRFEVRVGDLFTFRGPAGVPARKRFGQDPHR